MDSHKRSIIKAVTWRLLAALITTLVVYFFTEKAVLSLSIGLADSLIKIFTYYGHERLWERVDFGRKKPAKEDYQI